MSSGTKIIENALKLIGAHSIAQPADSKSISIGRDMLNSMLQLWLSQNIVLGHTPLDAPGDPLNEPADATNAIEQNLAIEMAPLFDNGKVNVSKKLEDNARRNFQLVKTIYQKVTVPNKVVSSTTPRGEGNRRYLNDSAFFDKGETISN